MRAAARRSWSGRRWTRPTDVDDDFPGSTEELFAEIERLTEARPARPVAGRPSASSSVCATWPASVPLIESGRRPSTPSRPSTRCPRQTCCRRSAPRTSRPSSCGRASCATAACSSAASSIATRPCAFAEQIDRAFAERSKLDDGGKAAEGYYEEFDAQDPFKIAEGARLWVREGGGLLAP